MYSHTYAGHGVGNNLCRTDARESTNRRHIVVGISGRFLVFHMRFSQLGMLRDGIIQAIRLNPKP